jgi:hypothetical protein
VQKAPRECKNGIPSKIESLNALLEEMEDVDCITTPD